MNIGGDCDIRLWASLADNGGKAGNTIPAAQKETVENSV